MYFAIFTLTVLATAVNTVAKSPPGPPPSGCSPNYPNAFEIVATGVPMIVKVRSWFYLAGHVQEANKFENSVKTALSSL